MRTTPRLTSWGCGEGVRGRRKATALRRLDYEECIGAKKHLVLGLLSHTEGQFGRLRGGRGGAVEYMKQLWRRRHKIA